MNVKEKKEHYLKEVKSIIEQKGRGEYEFSDHEDSKIKIADIRNFANTGQGEIFFYNHKGEQLPERQLIPRDLERVYNELKG